MRHESLRLNFTKRALEALVPGEKRLVYHDAHTHGLCLRVEPTGHKSFCWFRKINGRPTFMNIGKFPDLSVENARVKAGEYNTKFAKWKSDIYETPDPFAQRRELTFAVVHEDYIQRQLLAHAKHPDEAISRSRWKFDRYLSPWKFRKLGAMHREDVGSLHHDVGERHGRIAANRVVQFLRTLYNWALNEMNWSGENPVKRNFKFFAESSRTRFLQRDELKRLFSELRQEPNRDLRDFVVLALFTGARRSDVLSMRWENINFETATWTIPNPKSRVPYIVPLLQEALEILRERKDRDTGSWVFPGRGQTGHVMGLQHSWKALLKRTKITELRIHDLRRTLGSWMATGGASLPTIAKALGHQSTDVTTIYARLQIDAVREATSRATRAMLGDESANNP